MKSVKLYILCIEETKLLKQCTTVYRTQQNKIDTIFKNSENSKRSDPHRLLLNLSDKIN